MKAAKQQVVESKIISRGTLEFPNKLLNPQLPIFCGNLHVVLFSWSLVNILPNILPKIENLEVSLEIATLQREGLGPKLLLPMLFYQQV